MLKNTTNKHHPRINTIVITTLLTSLSVVGIATEPVKAFGIFIPDQAASIRLGTEQPFQNNGIDIAFGLSFKAGEKINSGDIVTNFMDKYPIN